jgi:hypothetical protein
MGKFKKIFSSTSWETSEFGGFSQILWDLPDMSLPFNFDVTLPKDTEYLGYYSKNKLLAYFLHNIKEKKLHSKLFENVKKETVEYSYGSGSKDVYTFNKNSVKQCLNSIIADEKELKSLFINYSNILANSKITCAKHNYERIAGDLEGLYNESQYLKSKIDEVEKKKAFSFFRNTAFNSTGSFKELKDSLKFVSPEQTSTPMSYTPLEVQYSDKLIDMLDISFEQDVTKITNLRTGKLDIPKIIESLSGNNLLYYRKELHDRTRPFTVCILNDESGSMSPPSMRRTDGYDQDPEKNSLSRSDMQHKVTKMLYRAFSQILPQDKIYVYGHTGTETPIVYTYQDKFNPTFESTYSDQFFRGFRENYDGPVISSIYDKIRSFTDEAILFIVISDGEPCGFNYGGREDKMDLRRIIEKCKRDSFVTCGIGFQYNGVKSLYNYNTIVNDLKDAPTLISMLVNNVVKSEFQ